MKQSTRPVCGRRKRMRAGVLTQEGAPGRWAGRQAFDTRLTTRGLGGWQLVLQAAWKVIVSHREDGLQVMQLLFLTRGLPAGPTAPFELFFSPTSFLFPSLMFGLPAVSFHSVFTFSKNKMTFGIKRNQMTVIKFQRATDHFHFIVGEWLEFSLLYKSVYLDR